MRFLVTVPATPESEAGVLPDEKVFVEMNKFNEEMVKAGVMLAAEGLQPTSKGAKIKYQNGKTTVIDGPFTESKELIAGFWLIQVKSREEAIEWMKRAPFDGGVEIVLRQVYEDADLPIGSELKEQETRLRQQVNAQQQPLRAGYGE